MERLKELANRAGCGLLRGLRGLVCEKKDGGWELSIGRAMSWIAFYNITLMAQDGSLSPEIYTYIFGGLMGYNGFKMIDMKGLRK